MLRQSKYERGELDDLASMTVENRSYAKVSSRDVCMTSTGGAGAARAEALEV